ncbi:hypothetical protein Salat_1678800 [Sesamum alatum]|uniref:Response regulatory domain-containing protein n=1 Tax=Sesamum alatum TaxID=300844 RepID=A0AAE1Y7F2_9LAMI|nr:hypothetical protein Salat_1678800 [Sesamum alatum]
MLDQNDAITTVMALEQGAYLCIKKPVTMQIVRYLWQHVLREKTGKIKEHQRLRQIADCNMLQKKLGEDLMLVSHQNNNQDVEEMHKSKKKVKTGTSQHDYVTFKTKKCRNANLLPPNDQRKWKLANAETKPPKTRAPRTKKVKFGSMPRMSNHQFHLQENHNKNQQEIVTGLPIENNVLGDNFCGSFDKGCYPQVHLDHNHSFAQDNETFDMTQFEQTFRMDEPFIDAANASSYQNDVSEDMFEFPNMDTMVHDFSDLLAELGMDYDRSFQSLVLDQNQVPNTDLWSHEVPKSVNAEEIEAPLRATLAAAFVVVERRRPLRPHRRRRKRVAGDEQSLQTLERLEARWHARYGDSGSGTLSTTIGEFSGSHLSESRTVACGSSPRTRVTETTNPLPPARVLLQDTTGLSSPRPVSPILPSTEATDSLSPDHADVYVGLVRLTPNPRLASDQFTHGVCVLVNVTKPLLKHLVVLQPNEEGAQSVLYIPIE